MEDKEQFKQALDEWLDKKFTEFGKWTLRSLGAIVFCMIIVYAVKTGLIKG